MVKGIFDTAKFDQIFFDDPRHRFMIEKIENVLRGASRLVTVNIIRSTFVDKTESILLGAGRQAYYYIRKRVSKLKAIAYEQAIRFRVKRGL